jgi:hypothetical protein
MQFRELSEEPLPISLLPAMFQHFISVDFVKRVVIERIRENVQIVKNVWLGVGVHIQGRKVRPIGGDIPVTNFLAAVIATADQ